MLGFIDSKPYAKRLADARRETGNREAAVYGRGAVGRLPVVVAALVQVHGWEHGSRHRLAGHYLLADEAAGRNEN